MHVVEKVIYGMKKKYPVNVTWHHLTSVTTNLSTGVETNVYLEQTIRRAVMLPSDIARTFVYDSAYMKSAREYTYGGLFDKVDQTCMIQKSDLTVDFDPNLDDYILWDGNTFNIVHVSNYANKAYIFGLARIDIEADVESHVIDNEDLIASGSGSDLSINDLVHVNGTTLTKATNQVATLPALGIVIQVNSATDVKYTPQKIVNALSINGSAGVSDKTIYLGTNGQATFDAPTSGLIQKIGFGISQNVDTTWKAFITIRDDALFI